MNTKDRIKKLESDLESKKAKFLKVWEKMDYRTREYDKLLYEINKLRDEIRILKRFNE
jgi:peptidoglycan hydrolase CwlO-like protein